MKLCMILSASRSPNMVVTEVDLERAIKILTHTEEKMPYVFSGVGKSNVADITSKILQYIKTRGDVPFSELMATFYYDADKFTMTRVIDSLESMNYIKRIVSGKETILRPVGGKKDDHCTEVN